MRQFTPLPTASPLPLSQASRPPPTTHLQLAPGAIAQFDALLHELHPDAPRIDIDRLENLAGWLLTLPPEQARDVLESRVRRMEELRAMLADDSWDTDPATRQRIAKLLDYSDRDNDLIDDHQPLLGLLDDVLLLELAWPMFSDEVADYRDFCDYRTHEHPTGTAAEQRAAWVRDRLAEIALFQYQLQIRESHFIESGAYPVRFRVA